QKRGQTPSAVRTLNTGTAIARGQTPFLCTELPSQQKLVRIHDSPGDVLQCQAAIGRLLEVGGSRLQLLGTGRSAERRPVQFVDNVARSRLMFGQQPRQAV